MLLQKGAHDIDVLHWLCRGYTRRVVGMGGLTLYDQVADRHDPAERGDASWHVENWPPLSLKGLNPVIDVEDVSMMLMHLDNGVFCSYQQCHYAPDGWRNYTIIGTEGRIENMGDSPGETTILLWDKRAYYNPRGNAQFFIENVGGSHGGADPAIVAEFVRYVREEARRPPRRSPPGRPSPPAASPRFPCATATRPGDPAGGPGGGAVLRGCGGRGWVGANGRAPTGSPSACTGSFILAPRFPLLC